LARIGAALFSPPDGGGATIVIPLVFTTKDAQPPAAQPASAPPAPAPPAPPAPAPAPPTPPQGEQGPP
jgi:hypothetical protein